MYLRNTHIYLVDVDPETQKETDQLLGLLLCTARLSLGTQANDDADPIICVDAWFLVVSKPGYNPLNGDL